MAIANLHLILFSSLNSWHSACYSQMVSFSILIPECNAKRFYRLLVFFAAYASPRNKLHIALFIIIKCIWLYLVDSAFGFLCAELAENFSQQRFCGFSSASTAKILYSIIFSSAVALCDSSAPKSPVYLPLKHSFSYPYQKLLRVSFSRYEAILPITMPLWSASIAARMSAKYSSHFWK